MKTQRSSAHIPPLSSADRLAFTELDRRLAVVRDRVRGVAKGLHTGFYLFGRPGTSTVISPAEGLEIAEFLISESKKLDVRLDMRHLVDKAFPDYIQHRNGDAETHWKDLIRTTLREQLLDLTHTPVKPRSRQDQKGLEQQIVREIIGVYSTKKERLAAWDQRTGKSPRAFYRRLQEVER